MNMNIRDIGVAGFGAQLIVKTPGNLAGTYRIEDFAPDSDMLTVDEVETAAMACTPDGKPLIWSKLAQVNVTIKLAPVSTIAQVLMTALVMQTRTANIKPIMGIYSIVTWRPGVKVLFTEGGLISGTPVETIGSERVADCSFKFTFNKVARVPLPF